MSSCVWYTIERDDEHLKIEMSHNNNDKHEMFGFFFLMNNVDEWIVVARFDVFVLQHGAQRRGQFGAMVNMHEPRISVLVHLLSS